MSIEHRLEIDAVPGFPLITRPCDISDVIVDTLTRAKVRPQDGDVVVVAQKVVSKAEGRLVDLREVEASEAAKRLAAELGKTPALVEVILRESKHIEKAVRPHLITEQNLGLVCANAGVDRSNVDGSDNYACLLPEDPDRTAETIRERLAHTYGCDLAVLITDTHGRPFRVGAVGLCIGAAGMDVLRSYVGGQDLFGREMRFSSQAVADELAAAASLVMGQGAEGRPLVIIRGFAYPPASPDRKGAKALVRPRESDLFRQPPPSRDMQPSPSRDMQPTPPRDQVR